MSKLEEKELQVLKEQEGKKSSILHDLGVLDIQKHSLLHAYSVIQNQQEETKKELEEKYGKINVDLSDGSFTKVEDESDSE
jgi:flagellar biosynthesis/type III secretory pathway chaperone